MKSKYFLKLNLYALLLSSSLFASDVSISPDYACRPCRPCSGGVVPPAAGLAAYANFYYATTVQDVGQLVQNDQNIVMNGVGVGNGAIALTGADQAQFMVVNMPGIYEVNYSFVSNSALGSQMFFTVNGTPALQGTVNVEPLPNSFNDLATATSFFVQLSAGDQIQLKFQGSPGDSVNIYSYDIGSVAAFITFNRIAL